MKKKFWVGLAVGVVMSGMVGITEASTWDLTSDFSTMSNPNGEWSYGRTWDTNVTGFDIMSVRWGASGWYMGNVGNGGPSIQSDLMWAKNNSNGYPVFRWTAPEAGQYQLVGKFSGSDSRGVDNWVYVTLDHEVKFQDRLTSSTDTTNFALNTYLEKGETINFLTSWAGGVYSEYGWVQANATINPTATPIPGAIWLLGSGFVGLIGARRKKK